MAKLAVTVTVFLFVIALSHARIPVDLTENDVTNHDLPTDLTESDLKSTTNMIFLPSDKTESEPQDMLVKHAINEAEPQKTESDSSESKTTTTFEPLAVINFRPINRQFPRRPSLLFRHRRPCHHHAMRRPWGPGRQERSWFENREVPYGKDMLMASDNKAERLRWYRGDGKMKARQIPARWGNFHDGDVPRFPFRHEDDVVVMKGMEEEEFKRPGHDHHHHHLHSHHHHDGEEEREGHEHKGGFLMKIRKFLTHF
ncbi:hypothetical protein ACOSP7_024673 [Xanthoceras sorbifolium]|uniref:Uncharacterized protein n=1 Tax=Xanthoceras sorbifolium TaxID=99658 RepID=A0ABQ8H8B7_9ROSI|nr:hypothetical protein JRO89_XS13G0142600 [Xanthoceras sorbifolium]KAH7550150.1 hypothetical protein JRO89_XS13G0142900 [Xanthoceras sorbifolium]